MGNSETVRFFDRHAGKTYLKALKSKAFWYGELRYRFLVAQLADGCRPVFRTIVERLPKCKEAQMGRSDESLRLTPREIAAAFDKTQGATTPAVLTIDEAADLLRIPKATLYDWRSRGLLAGCSRRVGKHVRFFRDRLIDRVFNQGISEYGRKLQQEQ
jgi:excisionase family DNA binding protein